MGGPHSDSKSDGRGGARQGAGAKQRPNVALRARELESIETAMRRREPEISKNQALMTEAVRRSFKPGEEDLADAFTGAIWGAGQQPPYRPGTEHRLREFLRSQIAAAKSTSPSGEELSQALLIERARLVQRHYRTLRNARDRVNVDTVEGLDRVFAAADHLAAKMLAAERTDAPCECEHYHCASVGSEACRWLIEVGGATSSAKCFGSGHVWRTEPCACPHHHCIECGAMAVAGDRSLMVAEIRLATLDAEVDFKDWYCMPCYTNRYG